MFIIVLASMCQMSGCWISYICQITNTNEILIFFFHPRVFIYIPNTKVIDVAPIENKTSRNQLE